MARKSRKEELMEMIEMRLTELDFQLLLPPSNMNDQEFQELVSEAVKLREMLKLMDRGDKI